MPSATAGEHFRGILRCQSFSSVPIRTRTEFTPAVVQLQKKGSENVEHITFPEALVSPTTRFPVLA